MEGTQLLFSKVNGYDPDSNVAGPTSARGVVYFVNPPTRSYLATLKFEFLIINRIIMTKHIITAFIILAAIASGSQEIGRWLNTDPNNPLDADAITMLTGVEVA